MGESMMTTEEARHDFIERLYLAEEKMFQDDNLSYEYDKILNQEVAVLNWESFRSGERYKIEAMKTYCSDIEKIPGCPFLVRDKLYRYVRSHNIKTSFGAPINYLEQLYGFTSYDLSNMAGADAPIHVIFNINELKQAVNLITNLEYLWADEFGGSRYEYGVELEIYEYDQKFIGFNFGSYQIFENIESPNICMKHFA